MKACINYIHSTTKSDIPILPVGFVSSVPSGSDSEEETLYCIDISCVSLYHVVVLYSIIPIMCTADILGLIHTTVGLSDIHKVGYSLVRNMILEFSPCH